MANEVKAMGSRLGVIVKTIDGWDIRYDHWSAQTLGRDIALDGYEATLTRIRQMAPYGVDTPQEMKSAPWLEGTLFIDMTTKRIVWAEESEGCYLPRLINALIELTWPGWTAIWSPEGTRGTLRATGADTDIIYTDHSFKDLGDFDAASDMAPWTISNETDAFSCTTENNKTITWGNYIDLENIALLGPNKMHTLVNKVIQGCNEGKPLAMEPPNTQQTTRKRHPHRLHKRNNKMVVHLRRRLGHQPIQRTMARMDATFKRRQLRMARKHYQI